jgi:hypothetical protein
MQLIAVIKKMMDAISAVIDGAPSWEVVKEVFCIFQAFANACTLGCQDMFEEKDSTTYS